MTTRTTGTTTPHVAQPKPKGKTPPKPTKKPTKKTGAQTGDQTAAAIAAALRAVAQGGGGLSASELRSTLEQAVWNQYVYLGTSSRFTSAKGTTRTKVRGSDLIAALTDKKKLTDSEFRQLQEKLFLGGFYGTNNRKAISWGNRYDAATRDAYASAIASNVIANQQTTRTTRISLSDIIDTSAQFGPQATQEGAQGEVFSYQPPDPAVLRETFRRVLPGVIGRGVSDAEVEQMVSEYMARDAKTERSKFDASQSGGTALPELASPADYAMVRGRQLHPVDAGVVDRSTAADTFLNAITGGTPATERF